MMAHPDCRYCSSLGTWHSPDHPSVIHHLYLHKGGTDPAGVYNYFVWYGTQEIGWIPLDKLLRTPPSQLFPWAREAKRRLTQQHASRSRSTRR